MEDVTTASRIRGAIGAGLSPFAFREENSMGRMRPEKESELRCAFQRDRDRIIHSKAFRRLMHKTQVFIAPEEEHYRTRLTHTLEVTQIARTIARALFLNAARPSASKPEPMFALVAGTETLIFIAGAPFLMLPRAGA